MRPSTALSKGILCCGIALVIAFLPEGRAAEQSPNWGAIQATGDEMSALFKAGRFKEAIVAAERHTAALEEIFGQGANETAIGFAYQAKFHARNGEKTKARVARDKAIHILSTTPCRDPGPQATTLYGLAVIAEELDDRDVAGKCVIEAAALRQQLDKAFPKTLADLAAELAERASEAGETDQAIQMYEVAVWATASAYGEHSKEKLFCLRELANHYESQGRHQEAAFLYTAAAETLERLGGAGSPLMADLMLTGASCREPLGEYAEAEAIARQASEIIAEKLGTEHILMARASALIARACARQGKWEQAELGARRAIDITKSNGEADSSDRTDAYLSLMLVYEQQGRYGEAEQLIRKALAESAQADSQGTDAMVRLSALAFILWTAGKHDEADKAFRQAIAACEKECGADSVAAASLRTNHAANHFYQGLYAEAEEVFQQSSNVLRQRMGDDHPKLAALSVNIATAQAAQGKWRLAAEQNDQGMRGLVREVRGQVATVSPAEQLRVLRGQYAIGYQAALTMGWLQRVDPRIRTLSASWLANGKAIAHEASARQAKQARGNGVATAVGGRTETDGDGHRWVDINAIRERVPRHAVLVDIARFDVFNYAAKRKGEDWQPARYVAWIVPPEGPGAIQIADLGEAKYIDTAVAEYRSVIQAALGKKGLIAEVGEAEAEKALLRAANPLAERILEPILEGVAAAGCAETAKELIISPDGELWLVPWSALLMADGQYLIESRAISTVTSCRDLLPASQPPEEPSVPMIFADPIFDLSAASLVKAVNGIDADHKAEPRPRVDAVVAATAVSRAASDIGNVERLPGSLIEASLVAEQIEKLTDEKPVALLQRQALEERAKRARSPRILHFATHGFVFPDQIVSVARMEKMSSANGRWIQGLTSEAGEPLEDPLLRCGLLLTGCKIAPVERPAGLEDGCLTGKEILSLDLAGTELVVLSACETGLGRVQYGEGVAGLRQAFLIAGADSVLASLWQVPDTPTVELMTGFFEKLEAGWSRSGALRHAQLAIIEKRRKASGAAHPAIWAGFEITGR
jgi:CHAT domain-containing protein